MERGPRSDCFLLIISETRIFVKIFPVPLDFSPAAGYTQTICILRRRGCRRGRNDVPIGKDPA